MRAFAYRSGEIIFKKNMPHGALPICRGDGRRLRKVVGALARHSRDGESLIVPGLPEARGDHEALAAFLTFVARVGRAMKRRRHA